jgi:hypothetical protein
MMNDDYYYESLHNNFSPKQQTPRSMQSGLSSQPMTQNGTEVMIQDLQLKGWRRFWGSSLTGLTLYYIG